MGSSRQYTRCVLGSLVTQSLSPINILDGPSEGSDGVRVVPRLFFFSHCFSPTHPRDITAFFRSSHNHRSSQSNFFPLCILTNMGAEGRSSGMCGSSPPRHRGPGDRTACDSLNGIRERGSSCTLPLLGARDSFAYFFSSHPRLRSL